ncbi:nitrogen assimilation regulatory protein [bacterium BMS3Abin03]|nr:nitrogen assimilation regulatory protein [bacterium BMS3Abin03]
MLGNKIKILVIDDDDLVVRSLKNVLTKIDYDVEICLDAGEADGKIQEYNPDIILLDIYLTTHNGIELLKQFKQSYPEIPIIMITGFSDVKTTVTAIKSGAFDFLLKPMELDYLKFVLGKAAEEVNLRSEVNKLQLLLKENKLSRDYFGKSRAIVKVLNFVEKLAKSSDTTILIEGESGTGKEVIAKYIYQNSPRANSPFIQINCSTIPNELAESELFGHERGAFTGAQNKTKLGKFELANGGTLLLDEIGDLNIDLQAKLLRVLQEKKFFRLGGQKEISVNVRILTATNKNLEDEVMKGNFREDLFYRLNVAKIHLPPLRERKGDIPLFAHVFLKEFSKKFNKKVKRITPEAIELLKTYKWKGNIRELKNVIERVTLLLDEDEIRDYHLSQLLGKKQTDLLSNDEFILNIPETGVKADLVLKTLIQKTLRLTDGNQVHAAKILGLSRSKLRYRMEQLGIEVTKKVN